MKGPWSESRYCSTGAKPRLYMTVKRLEEVVLAEPKSMSLSAPSLVHMMLSGVMSRCISPLSCIRSRSRSSGPSRGSSSSGGMRPPSSAAFSWSGTPSMNSMTR